MDEEDEEADVRRRAEDKTGRIKRARTKWTHESQILRRAGACMMFLFTGAPTRESPIPPVPILCPYSLYGIALASGVPYTLARRTRSSASLGWSIVSVTRTLCEAASIKPHFYSGTLHLLWPSGPPFPVRCSFATHILWIRHRVRAHPAVSRCIHCGFDFDMRIRYIGSRVHT